MLNKILYVDDKSDMPLSLPQKSRFHRNVDACLLNYSYTVWYPRRPQSRYSTPKSQTVSLTTIWRKQNKINWSWNKISPRLYTL